MDWTRVNVKNKLAQHFSIFFPILMTSWHLLYAKATPSTPSSNIIIFNLKKAQTSLLSCEVDLNTYPSRNQKE